MDIARTPARTRRLGLVGVPLRPATAARGDPARAEHSLALRLLAVHRSESALTASRRAVRLCRSLARRRPADFLPGLAEALADHWIALADPKRVKEALAASAEAVSVHARLMEDKAADAGAPREQHTAPTVPPPRRPEMRRWRLAHALSNHSVVLAANGRHGKAACQRIRCGPPP